MKKFSIAQILILTILTFAFCLVCNHAVFAEIKKGSTRAEVIDKYGEPSGVMSEGNEEILSYPGGMIVLIDGLVDQIDANFEMQLEQRNMEEQFKKAQKAKGLTEHKGEWITKTEKKQIEKDQTIQQPILIFKDGGKLVDLKDVLVPGKITLIDFYADWCEPCKKISPYLEHLVKNDPDVFLRKIDIVKWGTPVTVQYGIQSIPDVRVFDRNGRMIGRPTYNFNEIISYVGRAK
ncbi:MAG: thioredoxin family protein [Candidatus Omnitrophota bacterium]